MFTHLRFTSPGGTTISTTSALAEEEEEEARPRKSKSKSFFMISPLFSVMKSSLWARLFIFSLCINLQRLLFLVRARCEIKTLITAEGGGGFYSFTPPVYVGDNMGMTCELYFSNSVRFLKKMFNNALIILCKMM